MKRMTNNKSAPVKTAAVLFLICTVILSGCVDQGQNNTDSENGEPITDGEGMNGEYIYGTATVENIQIMTLESFPVQIHVIAEGYLPDGCTEIDEIKTEREENAFKIDISTKRPKDAFCTEAIVPFTETIPLEVRGLKAGIYTVDVNGVTGSFELAVDNILEGETPDSMPPLQEVITEADSGKSINLKNGDAFYLRLSENPTTGYSWELNLSQGLSLVSDEYFPPEQPEGVEQPLVGAGGVHLWEIKADSEGTQQVTAIYKRPWENETGKEDNFTLNVEVA